MMALQPPLKTISVKKGSWDALIANLTKHQSHLKEILESIERRDISPEQIKDYLQWIAKNLNHIRKKIS